MRKCSGVSGNRKFKNPKTKIAEYPNIHPVQIDSSPLIGRMLVVLAYKPISGECVFGWVVSLGVPPLYFRWSRTIHRPAVWEQELPIFDRHTRIQNFFNIRRARGALCGTKMPALVPVDQHNHYIATTSYPIFSSSRVQYRKNSNNRPMCYVVGNSLQYSGKRGEKDRKE